VRSADVNGVRLEYEVRGAGPPVVFVHAGLYADWFKQLATEPVLADHFRLVTYHRIGYAGSEHVDRRVGLTEQGDHCRCLMDHLGIGRAHLVGHSSGANIAMQVALRYPPAVASLALIEPAFPVVPGGPAAGQAVQRYGAGDAAAAVDTWMAGFAGPGYAQTMERVLPGAAAQAVNDASTFFEQELPAVAQWSFGPDDARRVEQPVLAMLGERTHEVTPVFDQRHELLLDWLPNVEQYVLPGATHLMHVQNSADSAAHLAEFFLRHGLRRVR
jgi:pimeloyl-ACP methyl ester carboxylesterase